MNTDGTLTSTHCNALQRLQRELCKELCKQSKKVKIPELYVRKEDKAWHGASSRDTYPPTRATQSRCFGRWRSLPVVGLEWLLAGAAGRMRYGLKVLVYVALSLTKLFFAIRFVLKYGASEELSLLKIHRYLYTAHRNQEQPRAGHETVPLRAWPPPARLPISVFGRPSSLRTWRLASPPGYLGVGVGEGEYGEG